MADRPKGFGMTAELNEKVNKMIRPSDLLSSCWVLAMIIIFSCIGPCIGPWVVTRETERKRRENGQQTQRIWFNC